MTFISQTFFAFFIIFFLLYWFVFNKSVKHQNIILLIGSYVFYAWVSWRFLFFLLAVSLLNYILGIYIEKGTKYKRFILYFGLLQGIGCLAYFKYYNFFITSFNDVFQALNINLNLQTSNIIIPLGISFFTFRTISYILDINKGKIEATKDWIVFFNYVSFFPSLLSGPIDKAKLFVPQLEKKREFEYLKALDGMQQILWGFFKKRVIADNCAIISSQIFDNYQTHSGSTLLLGAFLYTVQIYTDLSGYSDMSIGFSRLIGFNITKNFDFPLFSQNIAEFWRKWHISLTSWLTEYVFTPLSIHFRDFGKIGLFFAIVINLTIVGIWHGDKWTYVLFGFLHGCFYIPLIVRGTMNKKKKIAKGKLLPSLNEFINIVGTFTLVMMTLIIFRSINLEHAYHFFFKLCSFSIFSIPAMYYNLYFFILVMFITEWLQRDKDHALQIAHNKKNIVLNMVLYYAIIFIIILFSPEVENQFIYFKF